MTVKIIEPRDITEANLIASNVPETDHPVWDQATEYAEDARVIKNHLIWASVQDGNLNHDPEADDGTWWVKQLSTNRWKAFDRYIGDPSKQADTLEWTIALTGETVDSVALFNIEAGEVRIEVTSGGEGVHDETYDLQDESQVTDLYEYFFSPIVRADTLTVTSIPPYRDVQIRVVIDNTGGEAEAGQIIIGRSEAIGRAVEGVRPGIEDYSHKERDDFGRYSVVERDYAVTMDVPLLIDTARTSYLMRRIAERRAKLTVLTVSTRYRDDDLTVLGFPAAFQPEVNYAALTLATIEMEAIT